MDIRSVMTANPATCTPDATLRQAAQMMKDHDCGQIPVVGQDRQPVGVITDRDIAVRGVAKGFGPDTPVRELMTNDIVSARDDDDVEEAANRMSEAQVRRLPVIDQDQRLCGIVSLGDLARETDEDCAGEALEGVSQPGGRHQQ